ncbi:cytochrome-c peroxidase [Flavobacteriaceae bacterium UJ101]|nr:cytochrome-c peroxidase [Flavobacteriaceae bacterium UJ101]
MKKIVFTLLATSLLISCGKEEKKSTPVKQEDVITKSDKQLLKDAQGFFEPLEIKHKADNPVNDAKVKLGKILYHDTRVSKEGNISCNSCHGLETFGVDNKPFSPGDTGELGGRNSPTSFNAAGHFVQFWDGRAADVEEQAGGPVLNPVEHNIPSEKFLMDRLGKVKGYQVLFKEAFPDEANPITFENFKKAIGSFEREELMTPSRFDEFLKGDIKALSKKERQGLKTFIDLKCTDCHQGSNIGGSMYQRFGLIKPDYWTYTKSNAIDSGRYQETKNEDDLFMFKVPTLRNVEKTGPYFHDGSVKDLDEAIRIMGTVQLGREIGKKNVREIKTFLSTLTQDIPEDVKQFPEELNSEDFK